MNDEVAIAADLARDMFWVALKIGAPVLIVGLGVGIAAAVFQAYTQIHETTIALVPKMVAVIATAVVILPWALYVLADYAREVMGEMGHWFP